MSPSLELPTQLGPYRLLAALRDGKVSSVYRAADGTGRPVAVKVLSPRALDNPAAVERFHRAAAEASRLAHPNVLRILETGQEGDRLFLATELFTGVSLEQVLGERRLKVGETLPILKAVCRGLQHAHERGLLHLHLSPRHILVSPDLGTVKIADFGPSESEVLSGQEETLATGALTLGALHYLAPEQVDGRSRGVDRRADLYAAGVIFHQMLTGRAPGGRFTLPSHLDPGLPPEADVPVLKCLAHDPDERYADAALLLHDLGGLEEALNLRPLADLRGLSQRLTPAAGGGARRFAILGAILLIALLVLGGIWLKNRKDGSSKPTGAGARSAAVAPDPPLLSPTHRQQAG